MRAAVTGVMLLGLFAVPFSFAQQKSNSVAEQEIRAADMAWARVANAKDVDRTVGFYSEDALMMFPGMPSIKGKEGIRKQWLAEFADKNYSLTWHPDAVEASGNLGYSRGLYQATYTGPAGKGKSEHGKYLAIWKKIGGQWKVAIDMYNSDQE